MNVLVVDDDAAFGQGLAQTIRASAGQSVLVVQSYREACEKLVEFKPHVILVDYRLGDGSGHDVVRKAREHQIKSKMILMTAYADKKMAIESVNVGIDYFLEKPFELTQLRQVLQDFKSPKGEASAQSFFLNDRDLVVTWGENQSARLTLKEFKILKFFLAHEGQRVEREKIIYDIWPRETISSNVFDTHIYNLKLKLPFFKDGLSVVRGLGYCFQSKT